MDIPVGSLLGLFAATLALFVLAVAVLARLWMGHRRGLGYCLAILFVLAWMIHLFTGWQEFAAEQAQQGLPAGVWGPDGYM